MDEISGEIPSMPAEVCPSHHLFGGATCLWEDASEDDGRGIDNYRRSYFWRLQCLQSNADQVNRDCLCHTVKWSNHRSTGVKKSLATWAKGKGLEYCRSLQASISDICIHLKLSAAGYANWDLSYLLQTGIVQVGYGSWWLRCDPALWKAGGSGSKPFFHTIAVLSSETPGLRVGGKLCRFPMGCRVQDKLVLSKARDALGLDQCKIFIAGRWEGRYCHVSSVVDSASAWLLCNRIEAFVWTVWMC